jgi:hypothetical protein
MSPTARLVIRSSPRQDESLLGFLLRVSDANCYPGVGALLRLANLPRTFLTRPCALQDLASLLGGTVSLSQLEKWSYWPAVPKGIKFISSTVSPVDINLIHPKVCPACLEESGIARQVWDLRIVATCWRHECYLVDHCSECGSRLTWRRKRLLRCDCGSQLTRQAADSAPAAAIAFTLELEALLIHGKSWVDPFPMPIRSLSAVCRAVWWFGAELAGITNAQPLAIAKPRLCVSAKIVERGIVFLENWPSSFEGQLSRLRAAEPSLQGSQTTSEQELYREQVLYKMRQTFVGADFERMLDDVRQLLGEIRYPVKRNSFYSVRSRLS